MRLKRDNTIYNSVEVSHISLLNLICNTVGSLPIIYIDMLYIFSLPTLAINKESDQSFKKKTKKATKAFLYQRKEKRKRLKLNPTIL
jgi:hypothetical protein